MIMRYLLVLFLVMTFVAGCGCSNILSPPAYAQDEKDVWPIFYGTDNGGPDNGIIVFYDQLAAAWQAPRTVDTDLLDGQWTPQRNAVGWGAGGVWNVSFIEDTGDDLELWESPDAGWQDDAGAWAMLDGDASQTWGAVDAESRQGHVWLEVYEIATPIIQDWYIDLAAGVPALTSYGPAVATDNNRYSMVLDRNLYGSRNTAYIATNINYISFGDIAGVIDIIISDGDHPQIIVDGEQRLWCFYTYGNELYTATSFDQPFDTMWGAATLYTATGLDDDYHATWLKLDDTIHVVLVDYNEGEENQTHLIYLRRTPNGWTAPVTLLTVNSMEGANNLSWPQICCDQFGNLFISYLHHIFENPVDLQGFYLDKSDYTDYATVGVGGWIQHLNIDQSATEVVWAIMPDSAPITMSM